MLWTDTQSLTSSNAMVIMTPLRTAFCPASRRKINSTRWAKCAYSQTQDMAEQWMNPLPGSTFHAQAIFVPETVFLLLHFKSLQESKEFSEKFSFVQTSETNNPIYTTEWNRVSKEDQQWLSSRVKDFVVFGHSEDPSKMLPVERLSALLPNSRALHVLPVNALDQRTSVSYCNPTWALTAPSPALPNYCDGENFRSRLPHIGSPSTTPLPNAVDDDTGSVTLCEEPPDDWYFEQPMESVRRSDTEGTESARCCPHVLELKNTITALTDRLLVVESELRLAREALRRESMSVQEARQLATEETQRMYGMYRSERDKKSMMGRLDHLSLDGSKLTAKQIMELTSIPWLSYYRDSSKPSGDFMRCSLCNSDTDVDEYKPERDHERCAESSEHDNFWKNMLGKNEVMCMNRFSGRLPQRRATTNVVIAIRRHELSKFHQDRHREFTNALHQERSSAAADLESTASATLAAYTIAKEGLALQKQLPLLLMQLRAGAVPTSAHYSSRSARDMVATFARHMKYDMLKYVIESKLPFSLLVDGTSHDGEKWVVYLVRTVSPQNRPITFHLALVTLDSEKADDIITAFTTQLQNISSWAQAPGLSDEPYAYAMKRMIALSSDGASVMEGKHAGVHKKLRDLIRHETRNTLKRNDFLLSVCAAHKLNLVVMDQNGLALNLTNALVKEMHQLLGSGVATRARTVYSQTAAAMKFPVYENLALSGVLLLQNTQSQQYHKVDTQFLKSYHTLPQDNVEMLGYDPTKFPDYRRNRASHSATDEIQETRPLTKVQMFRPIKSFESLASQIQDESGSAKRTESIFDASMLEAVALGKAYRDIVALRQKTNCINKFYEDVRTSFQRYMAPESRPTENCVLPSISAEDRGYPDYIDDEGNVDKIKRDKLILESINAIERFCSLPGLYKFFMEFYNSIAGAVRTLKTWPRNFREDKTSVRFYKTLLDYGEDLRIPSDVREAIKCILVIPASNADPERSFSQANMLTRAERNRLGNITLNDLMTSVS
ncbi:hypothetical protein OSTOST_03738 [Ostertagia ostertagi]